MTLPEITTDVNFLEPQEGEEALGRFDIAHDDGDVIKVPDHSVPLRCETYIIRDSPDAPRTRTNPGTLAGRLQARREVRAATDTAQEQAQHLSRRRLEISTFFDWFRAIQARG